MENLKNESGRTMLEMLGVLGIMGIIMYGAVSGINYGMSTYKVNQVYNDVQEQMQGITDLYSWSRNYPNGDFTSVVCDNDIFSQGCTDDHKGSHPFGGEITVSSTGNDNFTLKYFGIPGSACERLSEMEWGNIQLKAVTCDGNTDMEWTWKDD